MGTPTPCTALSTQLECRAQPGCTWQ
jgi:hypothetical protein